MISWAGVGRPQLSVKASVVSSFGSSLGSPGAAAPALAGRRVAQRDDEGCAAWSLCQILPEGPPPCWPARLLSLLCVSPFCCPAELLDGAAKLAGSRVKLAAAQEEAKEQEGRLADLHRSVLQEAERAGLDLPGLAGQYDPADEDAAWEQLAATIQESERAAGGAGEAGGAEQQQQGPGADDGLQAAMQEAAMEGEPMCLGGAPPVPGTAGLFEGAV